MLLLQLLLVSSASLATEREWTLVNESAEWTPRAGLQVLEQRGRFYLLGGRTPRPPSFPPIPGDSDIWGDVWRSDDRGESWMRILETNDDDHWPARAYFNDVWKSRNGRDWVECTDAAPWEARAGGIVASMGKYMYLLGGENGFLCEPFPGCEVPYFNDVWRFGGGAPSGEECRARESRARRAAKPSLRRTGFAGRVGPDGRRRRCVLSAGADVRTERAKPVHRSNGDLVPSSERGARSDRGPRRERSPRPPPRVGSAFRGTPECFLGRNR
jgi:hypothetical protein